jgi:sulfide dehydrogenase cytochrome subunit
MPAAAQSCADCHGANGASTQPDVPIIGGLSAFSMEENLFAFRAGERPCRATYYRAGDTDRPATDMCRIASELSDDDIATVASYFASQPFVPADQAFDTERAERGRMIHESACHNCHGDGGSDPADHASILAGQWMNYLRMAFMHLRAGQRWIPKAMNARLDKLSDDDVENLVNFYGSGTALHDAT